MNRPTSTIGCYNALPAVLSHFADAIADNLRRAGGSPIDVHAPSIEMGSSNEHSRVRLASRTLRAMRVAARRTDLDEMIVLWPTFGYLEVLMWWLVRPRVPVFVILHDIRPLRQQFGYSTRLVRLANLATRSGRVRWIVHTEAARAELLALGFSAAEVVAHPVLPQVVEGSAKLDDVVVFGQYKPSRDLDLLSELGPDLAERGLRTRIIGRGWPDIAGWQVDAAFVEEASVPVTLAGASAVVIPYTHYYQSGVALRALEVGTPVVGCRTEFLESVFGDDWSGIVDGDGAEAWRQAIERARAVPPAEVAAIRSRTHQEACVSWAKHLFPDAEELVMADGAGGNVVE